MGTALTAIDKVALRADASKPMASEIFSQIVIGPTGSGKTRRLLDHVKSLLGTHAVQPDQILLISGTPGGAIALKHQLQQDLGETAAGISATTLQAWGLSVLRAYHIYHDPNIQPFNLYAADSQALARQFLDTIFSLTSPADYEAWLILCDAVDLDMLYQKMIWVLTHKDPILNLFPHQHIVIENAHHLSTSIELEILSHLGKNRSVWAGVDPFLSTKKTGDQLLKIFPQAQKINLEENFRSGPIVEALCILNPDLEKLTQSPEATTVSFTYIEHDTDLAQSQWLLDQLAHLKKVEWMDGSDVVIVCQGNGQRIEQGLHRAMMDTLRFGENRFYQTPEVSIVMAYLRLIHNPSDHHALMRVAISLGISEDQMLAWLTAAFHRKQSVQALCIDPEMKLERKEELQRLFSHLQALQNGYHHNEHRVEDLIGAVREVAIQEDEHSNPDQLEDAAANIELLLEEIEAKGWSLQALIDHVATLSELDDPPPRGEAILIVDQHEAYLLQDIPSHKCVIVVENPDVATNPQALYLAMGHSRQRVIYMADTKAKNPWKSKFKALASDPNMTEAPCFSVGDKINHKAWGQGKITKIEGENELTQLHLKFGKDDRVVMAKYAPISKV